MSGCVAEIDQRGQEVVDEDHLMFRTSADSPPSWPGLPCLKNPDSTAVLLPQSHPQLLGRYTFVQAIRPLGQQQERCTATRTKVNVLYEKLAVSDRRSMRSLITESPPH